MLWYRRPRTDNQPFYGPNSGLAYWVPFDEGAGQMVQERISGQVGQMVHIPGNNPFTWTTESKMGTCLNFNGANQISIPVPKTGAANSRVFTQRPTIGVTMCRVYKPNSTTILGHVQRLMDTDNTFFFGCAVNLTTGGTTKISTRNGSGSVTLVSYTWQTGVAPISTICEIVTYEPGFCKVYANFSSGSVVSDMVLQGSPQACDMGVSWDGGIPAQTPPILIDYNGTDGSPAVTDCILGDQKIYSERVFSLAECKAYRLDPISGYFA